MYMVCNLLAYIIFKYIFLLILADYTPLTVTVNGKLKYERALGKTANMIGSSSWVTLFSDC